MNAKRDPNNAAPVAKDNAATVVPEFATEDEERAFWATHDATPFWDQAEDVTTSPPDALLEGTGRAGSAAKRRPSGQKMELISLRFPAEMIEGVRAIADDRHLPYQTLLRSWVAERLDEERAAEERPDTKRRAS